MANKKLFSRSVPGPLVPATNATNEAGGARLRALREARARAVRRDGHAQRHVLRHGRGPARDDAPARPDRRARVPCQDGSLHSRAVLHEGHARAPRGHPLEALAGAPPSDLRPRDQRRQDAPQLRPDRPLGRYGPEVSRLGPQAARPEVARAPHRRRSSSGRRSATTRRSRTSSRWCTRSRPRPSARRSTATSSGARTT